jgi:hypothetical protein
MHYSYTGTQLDADTYIYANQFLIRRHPTGPEGRWFVFSNTRTPPEPYRRLVDRSFTRADDAMQYVRRKILHPQTPG